MLALLAQWLNIDSGSPVWRNFEAEWMGCIKHLLAVWSALLSVGLYRHNRA